MLVADFGSPRGDRRRTDERIVERPVSAEERSTIRGVDSLTPKPAAEIGRDTDVVGNAIAKTVAGCRAPGQIVLAPGKEVTRQRAAVTEVLLVEEHAVVERVEDGLDAGLDMTPGLLDAPPPDEVRREVLRWVKERRIAETSVGDVGRHRGATDRRRTGSAADRRRRQCRAGSDVRYLISIGEEGAERPGEVRARVLSRDRDRHAVG